MLSPSINIIAVGIYRIVTSNWIMIFIVCIVVMRKNVLLIYTFQSYSIFYHNAKIAKGNTILSRLREFRKQYFVAVEMWIQVTYQNTLHGSRITITENNAYMNIHLALIYNFYYTPYRIKYYVLLIDLQIWFLII